MRQILLAVHEKKEKGETSRAIGAQMVIDHRPAPHQIARRASTAWRNSRRRGASLLRSQVYEITFEGRAGDLLCAEFDDCEVSLGRDTTTFRAELPDQPALWGLLERMMEFGLRLIELRVLTVPSPGGSVGLGSPVA
jgi:hypothetical protein